MKKILFINAIATEREIEYRYPHLGLAYLASSIKKEFGDKFKIKIIDRNVESKIKEFRPDYVGLTSVTKNFRIAKQYASYAKKLKIPVLIGGAHITSLPNNLNQNMDVGILGEGEKTIIELLRLYKTNKVNIENLKKVNGIVFKNKNRLTITKSRELINPLDEIPFPSRDLLEIREHTYMFTSRGCPYRCTFCSSSRFWNKLRFFSAEYVIREIKMLYKKYKVRFISFYDDLFIANTKRLKKIVELLEKNDLIGKIKFSCSCRANLINEENVKLLKKMNVVSVGMGLESGCEKTLRYLKGGSVSIKDNKKAIKLLKKVGIAANASLIIGSPQETKDEIMETYNFIKKSGLNFFDTYLLTPFPATPIWEYAKDKGLVSDNMDWMRLDSNNTKNKNPVIMSETLSKKELFKLYKKFEKLRVWFMIKHGLTHPFSRDIPRFIKNKTLEFFIEFKKRVINKKP